MRIESRTGGREIPWLRVVVGGIVAGLAAGVAMALWTMLASATWEGEGWFTPLYVMASWATGGDEVTESVIRDGAYWASGPALAGALIHLLVAVALGTTFAISAALLGTRAWSGLAWGLGFGAVALVVMTFVAVPILDAVRMQRILSWRTWIGAHAVFGGVLGLWPFTRPDDVAVGMRDPTDLWQAA